MRRILCFGLGLLLLAGTAQADVVESVDFADGTLGTLIETGGPQLGNGVIDTTAGNAVFTGAGDGGRVYVGTQGTDFTSADFTATLDVTIQSGGGANAFFGVGPGDVDNSPGSPNSFGEPSLGPAAYVVINADSRDGGEVRFADVNLNGGNGSAGNNTGGVGEPVLGDGEHTVILNYDAATQTLTYFASIGSFASNALPGDPGVVQLVAANGNPFAFDLSDNGFDGTNSRIFFGGEDGTVFDNFQVHVPVPEPGSAIALLGLGVLATLRRKRG